MIKDEEFFNAFLKAFLTENLDRPLTEILKIMKVDRTTFYYHFYYYENFTQKAFDYFSQDLIKERIKLQTNNLFEIINHINSLIIKDLMKFNGPINFKNFNDNINLFKTSLEKKYKLLILNDLCDKTFTYKNKKYNSNLVLEEGFFSLINHIKNKELNFSKFYIISK